MWVKVLLMDQKKPPQARRALAEGRVLAERKG